MAFFYVLQGIGAARLSAVLSYVAGDGAALLVPLATNTLADGENRARGAASWRVANAEAVERLASVEVRRGGRGRGGKGEMGGRYMSSAHFELPEEAIAAGDETMEAFAPAPSQPAFEAPPAPPTPSPRPSAASDPLAALALLGSADDPFAASDSLLGGGGGELALLDAGGAGAGGVGDVAAAGGVGKRPENDPASLLAELEVRMIFWRFLTSSAFLCLLLAPPFSPFCRVLFLSSCVLLHLLSNVSESVLPCPALSSCPPHPPTSAPAPFPSPLSPPSLSQTGSPSCILLPLPHPLPAPPSPPTPPPLPLPHSMADAFGADLEAEGLGGLAALGDDEGDDAWGTAFGGSALLGGDGDAWGGGLDAAEFGVEQGEEDAFGLGGGGDLGVALGGGEGAAGGSAVAAARQLEVALGLGAMDGEPWGVLRSTEGKGAVSSVCAALPIHVFMPFLVPNNPLSASSFPPSFLRPCLVFSCPCVPLLPVTPAAATTRATAAGPVQPTFRVEERIRADFLGSSLTRVRLSGTVFLTLPLPKGGLGAEGALGGGGGAIGGGGGGARVAGVGGGAEKDGSVPDEFSFRLEGSGAIKRCTMRPGIVSDLGKGYFHFRMPPPGTTFPPLSAPSAVAASPQAPPMADLLGEGDEGMGEVVNPGEGDAWGREGEGARGAEGRAQEFVLMKYRLQPRYTPIPLRLRFVTRRSDEALSLMIQYVANPYLQAPLLNVTFILSLAFSPASLRLNPEAQLDPWTKELRWHVPQITVRVIIAHISAHLQSTLPDKPCSHSSLHALSPFVDLFSKEESFSWHLFQQELLFDLTGSFPNPRTHLPNRCQSNDPPQRLRAQIPVIPDDLVHGAAERTAEEKQAEEDRKAKEMAAYRVRVEFECRGSSLSGVTVGEVMASGKPPFAVAGHSFSTSEYICS
ncbi:unnamed protein product [Closterium sp. NIES-53]